MGIFPNFPGENKNTWNHHLVLRTKKNSGSPALTDGIAYEIADCSLLPWNQQKYTTKKHLQSILPSSYMASKQFYPDHLMVIFSS